MTYFCEVCGNKADIHHIIHKREGGLDFYLNYKYLCHYHHRGNLGPHKNKLVDLTYKLELQNNLKFLLLKEHYTLEELHKLLFISRNSLKRLTKNIKLYKEGYSSNEIIFTLMGKKDFSQDNIDELILENIESKII